MTRRCLVALALLATPVLLMYEGCIWIVWLLETRRRKQKKKEVVEELLS